MFSFKRASIKHKLIFMIMLTTLCSLLSVGAVLIVIDQKSAQQTLVDRLDILRRVISDRSTAAIKFEDEKTAKKILASLEQDTSVRAACLYTLQQTLLATYYRSSSLACPSDIPPEGTLFKNKYLHLSYPILLKGETIGTLYIAASKHELKERLYEFSLIVLVTITIASIVGFLLASLLQRSITGPIISLKNVTDDISQNGDYSKSLPPASDDEIGALYRSFNRMISQIRLRDEQRRQSDQELRIRDRAFAAVPDGIIITDSSRPDNPIIYCNQAAQDITGYSEQEILGNNPRLFRSNGSVDEAHEKLRKAINEERSCQVVLRNFAKDGHEFWVELTITPVRNDKGQLSHYIGIQKDITAHRLAENEKSKLETQLRRSQKLETIGTMVGGIAHDFNNILTPILGYTDMMLTLVKPSESVHNYLQEVFKGANRAKELVGQILLFSKNLEKEREPIRVHLVVEEAIKLLRPSIPMTINIQLDIDTSCDRVFADSSQIHQVIVNLCTNAWHAMEDNGGIMCIRLTQTSIDNKTKKIHPNLNAHEYACLSIIDTGAGMNEETVDRIFEPFYTTKDVDKGTGLRLSVVHGIINSHDGAILVDSTPGEGSAFHVYLPIATEKTEVEKIEPEMAMGGQESILLVDDDTAISRMVKEMLEAHGYSVDDFSDSAQALKIFLKTPDNYDLLISDLTMPTMTGDELAKKIKAIRPELPVIIITGYGETLLTENSEITSDIQQVLIKPILQNDLLVAIRQVLRPLAK